MFERIKIQSMPAVVEKTPSGEGPEDEAQMFEEIMVDDGAMNNEPKATKDTGIKVVDGPGWKYVTVAGGDIKNLAVDAIAGESANYITKIEGQILQAMGIPHSILLSPEKMSGRMSDGVCKLFNATIAHRQKILDKMGKKIIAQALAKAMDRGEIKPNWDDNFFESIHFTHPRIFTLNDSYDRQDDLDYFKAGLRSMNDITLKANGKTAKQTMQEIANEIALRHEIASETAKDIEAKTGQPVDPNAIADEIKGNFDASNKAPEPEKSPEDKENNEEEK